MTISRISVILFPLLAFQLSFASPVFAGFFDNPENLKVLPKEISPEELGATMRGFAINTGSRCSTCHVYEDEANLETYDFAADDKEKKRIAREMLEMVSEINSRIEDIQGVSASELVRVDCATCHRGQDKPRMLPDVLEATYRADSLEATMAQYRELRKQYYGGYVFDFSPRSLDELAQRLAAGNDVASAVALVDLNLEFNPEYSRAHVIKAEILMKSGDVPAARQSLLKAIEMEPENQWYQMMLQRLDASSTDS